MLNILGNIKYNIYICGVLKDKIMTYEEWVDFQAFLECWDRFAWFDFPPEEEREDWRNESDSYTWGI